MDYRTKFILDQKVNACPPAQKQKLTWISQLSR